MKCPQPFLRAHTRVKIHANLLVKSKNLFFAVINQLYWLPALSLTNWLPRLQACNSHNLWGTWWKATRVWRSQCDLDRLWSLSVCWRLNHLNTHRVPTQQDHTELVCSDELSSSVFVVLGSASYSAAVPILLCRHCVTVSAPFGWTLSVFNPRQLITVSLRTDCMQLPT